MKLSINMGLGLALKEIRSRTKRKQNEVAKEAGISVSYLCMLEAGSREPTISVLNKIAKVYGLPWQALVWLSFDKKASKKINCQSFFKAEMVVNDFINELIHQD